MRRALTTVALATLGCGQGESPLDATSTLRVRVEGPTSVADLAVSDDGEEIGRTNAAGMVDLISTTGRAHQVSEQCPGRERANAQAVHGPDPGQVLELAFRCEPVSHQGVVVVSAHGRRGVPVLVDGVVESRTDEDGYAMLRVRRREGESFRVTLDAAGLPLDPRESTRIFRLENRDELFLYGVELRKKEQRPSPRRAPLPKADGPYRLR